jgi:hypothetical protein
VVSEQEVCQLAREIFAYPATWAEPRGCRQAELESALCGQAKLVYTMLFDEGEQWCRRRVERLRFIGERRGEWTNIIDFAIPRQLGGMDLLSSGYTARGAFPVMLYPKESLPFAHVRITDESDRTLSLVENEAGVRLAFIILLALAEEAGCCRTCTPPALRKLVDPDPVLAAIGRSDLLTCTRTASESLAKSQAHDRLAVTARLFYRSILVLMELDHHDLAPETRKIIRFQYDGPVRVTRNLKAALGLAPRVIAPRAIYGGDARSYNVQAEAPDLLMIVDTLLIFSSLRRQPPPDGPSCALRLTRRVCGSPPRTGENRRCSAEAGCMKPADHLAREKHADPLLARLGSRGWSQWWGYVQGSAEPMAAHVRTSHPRLPRLRTGRDACVIFRLYPQFSGVLSRILYAGLVNVLFVAGFVAGVTSHQLTWIVHKNPETLFVAAAIIAGLGVGITRSPKDHLLANWALAPWRRLEGLIIALTIVTPATALLGRRTAGLNTCWLCGELAADFALLAALLAISARPWLSEANGSRAWRSKGFPPRRAEYPRKGWPWRRAIDSPALAESDTRNYRRPEKKIRKQFVRHHLDERRRTKLYNQGLPVAIRHGREDRG